MFFLALQYWEPPDFLKIMGEAGFGREDRQRHIAGHNQALQLVSKQNYLYPIIYCNEDGLSNAWSGAEKGEGSQSRVSDAPSQGVRRCGKEAAGIVAD